MPRGRLSRHPALGPSKQHKLLPPANINIPSPQNVKSMKTKHGVSTPPADHCEPVRSPTTINPPSSPKTSPFVSPCDDCLPQAMSTPRSALDDFLMSQGEQGDVRWDTSSPDAFIKARKVASKDHGRSTIQMLAAGIKREPMAESPTTPALVSLWLVRGEHLNSDAPFTPKSDQQRSRCSRRIRALQKDRAEREVSTKNLMKKLTDLIEQEKEQEPVALEVQTSDSDDLTFSAAVAQLANLSTDDDPRNDDDVFNNSALIQPSAVIHPIPIKRTPRSKNRTEDDDDVKDRESQKENPVDSSWDDDDLFMNDDFIVQASQLTDALFDPNTKRFRTPKVAKKDESKKRKTPLRNAMSNSISRTNIDVGACVKPIPKETSSNRQTGAKPSSQIEVSSLRTSKTTESAMPIKSSISKPLPNKGARNPTVPNCSAKPVIKKLSSEARPIRSAEPRSNNNNDACHDSKVMQDSVRSSKPPPNQTTVTKSEVLKPNFPTGSLVATTNSCELDVDTSVSDDILLRLAEPDTAWESQVSGGNGNELLWDDDDDDGDFDLPDQQVAADKPSESPIPPTVILPPSPQKSGSRTLTYKPGLISTSGASTEQAQCAPSARSTPPAQSAVAADDFDDDSFCQPDILAKLEQVELEATQSLKTSQSPTKSRPSPEKSSQSPHGQASLLCSSNEIQRKKEAALKKRRLAQINKDGAKKGKFL